MSLVGATVQIAGRVWTVDSYVVWSKEQYVWLRLPTHRRGDDLTIRPAAVIARTIQLQKDTT